MSELRTIQMFGKEERVRLEFQRYENNGRMAVLVVSEDGSPYGKLSVNVPDEQQAEHEVFVKTWNENEALAAQILKVFPDVFSDTGKTVPAGHVDAAIWNVLKEEVWRP